MHVISQQLTCLTKDEEQKGNLLTWERKLCQPNPFLLILHPCTFLTLIKVPKKSEKLKDTFLMEPTSLTVFPPCGEGDGMHEQLDTKIWSGCMNRAAEFSKKSYVRKHLENE